MPHPMVHLHEVEKQLAAHDQTVYTKVDLMQVRLPSNHPVPQRLTRN